MISKVKRKLNSNKALTFAEMLIAMLILLMVSAIVAEGIPAAKKAYEKVVVASNAEVLMSTTITALRNELGTAMNVQVSGTEITYYNSQRCSTSRIRKDGNDIKLQRYYSADGLSAGSAEEYLMSAARATNNLHITYDSVVIENENIIKFTNLSVIYGGNTLVTRPSFSIKILSR